ncbi:MAG TPA: type VI secretion system baseplate subunit TssE [Pseudomonadota bacterium]|jgi:type VI secretion system lysozyme-like protein|nr:type VI secretion system baseplate subunit TssE [Pseudomonadota bacterium]HNN50307.1 type VI secretion system baseplate subunit TssE [Pseudomonadota bacterium]
MSFLNRFLPDRPQDDPKRSVVRNLENLLNARRGFGSLLCHFGAADYLKDGGGSSATQTLLREIRDTITTYEPRLRLVSLKVIARDEKLRLLIDVQGTLLSSYWGTPCRLLIRFHVPTGAVSVEVTHGS